jgi:hypothetical protein
VEDFVDRYENIAIAGLAYCMFAPDREKIPAFYLNHHVYSCILINNKIKHRWRGRYNEDTDLCLQVLSEGWCTVLVNVFLCMKMATMRMTGGNTDQLYRGDGRLRMARALHRMWPRVVEVKRRWGRPQHVIKGAWGFFDTPLKLKKGVQLSRLKPNEYGLELVRKSEVKSQSLETLLR